MLVVRFGERELRALIGVVAGVGGRSRGLLGFRGVAQVFRAWAWAAAPRAASERRLAQRGRFAGQGERRRVASIHKNFRPF